MSAHTVLAQALPQADAESYWQQFILGGALVYAACVAVWRYRNRPRPVFALPADSKWHVLDGALTGLGRRSKQWNPTVGRHRAPGFLERVGL